MIAKRECHPPAATTERYINYSSTRHEDGKVQGTAMASYWSAHEQQQVGCKILVFPAAKKNRPECGPKNSKKNWGHEAKQAKALKLVTNRSMEPCTGVQCIERRHSISTCVVVVSVGSEPRLFGLYKTACCQGISPRCWKCKRLTSSRKVP